MVSELPNHRYYRANHGLWRSDFDFGVSDWGRFRASSMGLMGEQVVFPLLWRARGFGDSRCRIDESGTRGTYSFPWFGGRLDQTTQVVEGGADITMDTGWGGGVQRLRRREA